MALKYTVFVPILITLYSISIVSTVFRLLYRAWYRKLWWDDFWAAFSLVNATLLFTAYVRLSFGGSIIWLARYESIMVFCRFSIWGARLSVAVTIVRVIATGIYRLVSKIMAVIFGALAVSLLIQKLVMCRNPADFHLCRDTSNVTGYSDLASSFFSDFWLLGAPAYLLWGMHLNKQFHRLLQAIFACEILVLVTSIVHCIYTVKNNLMAQGIVAHFKVTISLLVCNLLCLVTYIYRLSHNGENPSESTTSAPTRPLTDWSASDSRATADTSRMMLESQTTHFTSNFTSSGSQQSNAPRSLYESEPGITERMWSIMDTRRAFSSV